jgi:hypothetical protein
MTRALSDILGRRWYLKPRQWRFLFTRRFWRSFPRPGYCEACYPAMWSWLTYEQAPYSTAYGFVCEECAIRDEEEMNSFWRSHYGY